MSSDTRISAKSGPAVGSDGQGFTDKEIQGLQRLEQVRLANARIRHDDLRRWKRTLERASAEGLVSPIQLSDIETLTPAHAGILLASCGIPHDSEKLPRIREWKAKDILDYSKLLGDSIKDAKDGTVWYNNRESRYRRQTLRENISFLAVSKGSEIPVIDLENQIINRSWYGLFESHRQAAHAVPHIVDRMYSDIKDRVSMMQARGDKTAPQASEYCEKLGAVIKQYKDAFLKVEEKVLTSLSAQTSNHRELLFSKCDPAWREDTQRHVLASGGFSFHQVPFEYLRPICSFPDVEEVASQTQPVLGDQQGCHSVEDACTADKLIDTTTPSPSEDEMLIPIARRETRELLESKLAELDYHVSRNMDANQELEETLIDAVELARKASATHNSFLDEYKENHGLQDDSRDSIVKHVQKAMKRKNSHTKALTNNAVKLKSKYRQLNDNVQEYHDMAQNAYETIMSKIDDKHEEVRSYRDTGDANSNTMCEGFSEGIQADKYRMEKYSLPLRRYDQERVLEEQKRLDSCVEETLERSRSAFESVNNFRFNGVTNWDDFLRVHKDEKDSNKSWADRDSDDEGTDWFESLKDADGQISWQSLVKNTKKPVT